MLSKSGSDCCEDYFSQNGSFVLNKHTYTFGDMIQNLQKMNRLLQMQANPDGPTIEKCHKKQENIWAKGTDHPAVASSMRDFPSDDGMIAAWNSGVTAAQLKRRQLGMAPDDEQDHGDDHDDGVRWFYMPHQMNEQDERVLLCAMASEGDECRQPEASEPGTSQSETQDESLSVVGSLLRQQADELDAKDDASRISSTIQVSGIGTVCKSTLLSLINSDEKKLSKGQAP
jgi:hypothetical protein